MSLALDIILAIVIVVTVICGIRRGFVKSVMGLVSLIVSILLAYKFTAPVALYFKEKFVKGPIVEKISDAIGSLIGDISSATDWSALFGSSASEAFKETTERYGADYSALATEYGDAAVSPDAVNNISSTIAEPVAGIISNVLGFIAVFVGSLIVLWFVTLILNQIVKLPLLKGVNTMLGLVFGCICALAYAVLFSKLAVLLVDTLGKVNPDIFTAGTIGDTILVKWFSESGVLSGLMDFLKL